MQQRHKDNYATLVGGIFIDIGNALQKCGQMAELTADSRKPAAIEQKNYTKTKEVKLCQKRQKLQ